MSKNNENLLNDHYWLPNIDDDPRKKIKERKKFNASKSLFKNIFCMKIY
jgi:hypothetical protein